MDGEGNGVVIGVGVLTKADKESVAWFIANFIKHNFSATRVKVVMSDKDLIDRIVLKK